MNQSRTNRSNGVAGKGRLYMGIIKNDADIAQNLGIDVDKLPAEARGFLIDVANRNLQEELSDREAFATELDGFSDDDLMAEYGAEPSQMAHVGNSMRQDIAGGNRAGVTTCLVRRAGYSIKVVKFFMKGTGLQTKGHLIREKLLERDLWRKHHKEVKGDQYYQLGELPKYRAKRTFTQENVAKLAAADLITKINADKDKTFTLEEIQRNICKNHESKGMKTLRTHLGDDIIFYGFVG